MTDLAATAILDTDTAMMTTADPDGIGGMDGGLGNGNATDTLEKAAKSSNPADAEFDVHMRIVMLHVFIALGLVGGVLVCCWLWYNRRRKSRVNMLILHVTVSDLVVIFFACTSQLVWEYFDRHWLAGNVMCKVVKYMQSVALMASNNMLVVLSLDRHQAIRAPLRAPFGVCKMVIAGWVTACALSLPQFYLFHTNFVTAEGPFTNKTVCEARFRDLPPWHRTAYLTFINVVVFYIPFVLIGTFYIRIFLKISTKVKESTGSCKEQTKPGKVRLVPSSSSSMSKAKIKTLKMTIVIVITFVLCTAPYQVMEIIYNIDHTIVSPGVAAIIGSMAVANSSINPYVFLLFNANANCIRWFIKVPGRDVGGYEPTSLSTRTEYTTASTHGDLHKNIHVHASHKYRAESMELGQVKQLKAANEKAGGYAKVSTK